MRPRTSFLCMASMINSSTSSSATPSRSMTSSYVISCDLLTASTSVSSFILWELFSCERPKTKQVSRPRFLLLFEKSSLTIRRCADVLVFYVGWDSAIGTPCKWLGKIRISRTDKLHSSTKKYFFLFAIDLSTIL